jgi:spermidine synthase
VGGTRACGDGSLTTTAVRLRTTPPEAAIRFVKPTLYLVFFASGASALICQSVWQRVLSLHAGMDLFSTTTVVAAFMAGLGLGSLLGGALADRVTPVRALFLYALCEACIGAFGLISVWLLYFHYPSVSGRLASFGAAFLLLIVPTTVMGMTLPILSRGLVQKASDIAPQVGRLFALNTAGAAAGAAITSGPLLLASIGLVGTVRVAASLNLASALFALALVPVANRLSSPPTTEPPRARAWIGRPWHWATVYGLTGFVSLALEVSWFRLLNVLLISNTYTFARLLTVYLTFLGIGAWLGARRLSSVRRPDLLFLWLQLGVGVAAAVGPLVAIGVARHFSPAALLYVAPLLVLPLPTFLMGFCFPLVQRLVADNFAVLGRRVGLAVFANTVGCVLGTIVTGFFLLDRLGTPATLRLLVAMLGLFGCAAGILSDRRSAVALAAVVAILAVLLIPRGTAFWAPLHAAVTQLEVREDGSCVTATGYAPAVPGIKVTASHQYFLFINGELQNGIPFDDFHIRLGVIPALAHPAPRETLVIGLGAGSTPFGLGLDPRVGSIDLVEICGTEVPLLESVRDKGMSELAALFQDPRVHTTIADGRKYLLANDRQYDLIITDTLPARSAFSGSLYSREFYELARSRLRDDGLFAQWIPSARTLQTVASVFPYVSRVYSPAVPWPRFMLASKSPLPTDGEAIRRAYAGIHRDHLRPESLPPLDRFMKELVFDPAVRDPERFPVLNHDLFAHDEYADQ